MAHLIATLASSCPLLCSVNLKDYGMGHGAGEALLQALASNPWPKLTELNIGSNALSGETFWVRLSEVLEGGAGSCTIILQYLHNNCQNTQYTIKLVS